MSRERRFELLYGSELKGLIKEKPLAWVPLGILEKHGEHAEVRSNAFTWWELYWSKAGHVHHLLYGWIPTGAFQVGENANMRHDVCDVLRLYSKELRTRMTRLVRRQQGNQQ